jgi:hypothetical protein
MVLRYRAIEVVPVSGEGQPLLDVFGERSCPISNQCFRWFWALEVAMSDAIIS